ncbi:hypothetical protein NQ318_002389, partial [Aromia moschata]
MLKNKVLSKNCNELLEQPARDTYISSKCMVYLLCFFFAGRYIYRPLGNASLFCVERKMDGPEDPATAALLEASRFWVQKVLVPITVTIGITGNTISVMVLTSYICLARKRMRNSTNIYLSALAIADIIHLFFVFLLSFRHYSNIHDGKYALYWRFHGLSYWFCDAASSTSIWLTVSFTVERYIAVCHPIRGNYFCTERRAKCVIVIVYIFCIITTASTTFERQLTANETCIEECKSDSKNSELGGGGDHSSVYLERVVLSNSSNRPFVVFVPHPENALNITQNKVIKTNLTVQELLHPKTTAFALTINNVTESSVLERPPKLTEVAPINTTSTLIDNNVEPTKLGQNEVYKSFINWYSAVVFVLLPLVLIATFNCFLINAVYRSQRMRRTMTNSQESISYSNEKRITVMLISVVILFIVCHTPSSIYLIFNVFHESTTKKELNIELRNIFNFFQIFNASCNFLLYCFMSKKFRSTFKQLFFERRKERRDTIMLSSTKSRNSQKFDPKRHGVIRRNASEYRTPRDLE